MTAFPPRRRRLSSDCRLLHAMATPALALHVARRFAAIAAGCDRFPWTWKTPNSDALRPRAAASCYLGPVTTTRSRCLREDAWTVARPIARLILALVQRRVHAVVELDRPRVATHETTMATPAR